MELDEFVSSTLLQVIKGVHDAQNQHGKLVNPYVRGAPTGGEVLKYVEFDVAVTVEDKNVSEGGAKIAVMGSKLGGSISSDSIETATTRIKFSVPLKFGVDNG